MIARYTASKLMSPVKVLPHLKLINVADELLQTNKQIGLLQLKNSMS